MPDSHEPKTGSHPSSVLLRRLINDADLRAKSLDQVEAMETGTLNEIAITLKAVIDRE